MANLLVRTDTLPVIHGTITHATSGLPRNLSGCTVFFQLRLVSDHAFRINAECVVEDALGGEVSYDLSASDLDFSGDCLGRFLIVDGDNKRQHTVPSFSITVEAE